MSCWHCDLADALAAMAAKETDERESDALACMAMDQAERCDEEKVR